MMALLTASALAEPGFTCVNLEGDDAWAIEEIPDVKNAADCKEKGTARATGAGTVYESSAYMDYCLSATVTPHVLADEYSETTAACVHSCKLYY